MNETTSRSPAAIPATASERDWLPFEGLRREIDHLFDGFRPFGGRNAVERLSSSMSGREWTIAPAFDFAEKDGEYEVTAELPGMDEKDIEIRMSNHTLIVKGEKSETKEEGDERSFHLSERRFGSFQRSFEIPEGIDADRVEAQFAKGVLTIHLPKTPEARRAERRVSIKAA